VAAYAPMAGSAISSDFPARLLVVGISQSFALVEESSSFLVAGTLSPLYQGEQVFAGSPLCMRCVQSEWPNDPLVSESESTLRRFPQHCVMLLLVSMAKTLALFARSSNTDLSLVFSQCKHILTADRF